MKTINKICACLISAFCLFACVVIQTESAHAVDRGKTDIYCSGWTQYEVTNDKGEILKYNYAEHDDPSYPFSGSMKVYKKREVEEMGWWATVEDSKIFTIRSVENDLSHFYIGVDIYRDDGSYVKMEASDVKSIDVRGTSATVNPMPGRTCKYNISTRIQSHSREYYIEGYTSESFTFKKDGNGMLILKANGKVNVAIRDKKKEWIEDDYYFYNENVKISLKKNKLNVTPGIKIDRNSRKDIKNVKLQVTNKGNNMFLKWDKVKKAKSYIVYRYNDSSKRFERETVRNTNYYDISNPSKNKVYKYKVEARTGKNGGGKKIAKRSYEVWAVAGGSTKTNATKVEVKKKKITAKKGKKIKVKATVKKKGSKPLLSKKVSWHTSNSKIAAVDKKTGKIILKKRGKCTIWAKSHNGVNSKSIKITVR